MTTTGHDEQPQVELANGWCSECLVVVAFDKPSCGDHDADCPELICCLCGSAYVGAGADYYVAAVSTTPTSAAVTPAA